LTEQPISDFDLHLFGEGNHQRIYDKLGAHPYSSGAASGAAGGAFGQTLRLNLPPLGAMFFAGP
jgi:1,4-alpha-glucan branching enzyme